MAATEPQFTKLLEQAKAGSESALDQLLPLVYAELRSLAAAYLKKERGNHTLQPTALVHEAYLRLVQQSDTPWSNRTHFLAVAARVMRKVLIDSARRRRADKRGSDLQRVTIHEAQVPSVGAGDIVDVVDLDEALTRLAKMDERKTRVIELRFFGGMTNDEISAVLGVSRKTVVEDWTVARAWLGRELKKGRAS